MTAASPALLPSPLFPGSTTAAYVLPELDVGSDFGALPLTLRGMETRCVYISPAGDLFNLTGPMAGLEGVRIITQLTGDQSWPIEQVLTRSPYIMGARINRTNVGERHFQAGIMIGSHSPPLTEYQYRMANNHWWASQDENNDGWFGMYTRFSGWRWIPLRIFQTIKTPQRIDPTAFGNNAAAWDISWIAQRPWFTKVALYDSFQASMVTTPTLAPAGSISGTPEEAEYYWGTVVLANRGDLPSCAQFFITSPGQAIVQDNDSQRLVVLPLTTTNVGTYMCDTAPGVRTLTAANDPSDNLLFDFIRQSTILDFFLGGIANEGLPLAMQFQNRFIYQVPPQTVCSFTVGHSNPGGVITVLMPQMYKRGT